jgi:hypothetical protein
MYTPIPLQDASFSEVLARVTFRVLQRDYHRYGYLDCGYVEGIEQCRRELEIAGFRAISTWIAASQFYLATNPYKLVHWRDEVCRRARASERNRRAGKPWARVG